MVIQRSFSTRIIRITFFRNNYSDFSGWGSRLVLIKCWGPQCHAKTLIKDHICSIMLLPKQPKLTVFKTDQKECICSSEAHINA